jgi:hypothetical protein
MSIMAYLALRLKLQAKHNELLIWHRQGREALEKHLGLVPSNGK